MFEFNGCDQMYGSYWADCHVNHTMSEAEFDAWYDEHCAKCPAMSEICMADVMDAE